MQKLHPTRAGDASHGVQELHPNLSGTVKEPVCAADADEHTLGAFEEFWAAYPRAKDRDGTKAAFLEAVAAGADAQAIVAGAKAYADENRGNSKQYIAYPANWLKAERWRDHEPKPTNANAAPEAIEAFWAKKVKAGCFIPSNGISASLAHSMINGGHVTAEELQAAGVSL